MNKRSIHLLSFCLFAAAISACNKESLPTTAPATPENLPSTTASQPSATPSGQPSPAVPLHTSPFLSAPVETRGIEAVNGALPVWRRFAKHRPMLAVVTNAPGLVPIPEVKRHESRQLLREADDATLTARTGLTDPDPVILPAMSISAALDAGWFEGVVWIFPTTAPADQINLELFRSQLLESGIATPAEASTLTLSSGVLRGTLRSKPFIAAPLSALPELQHPLLLHIDSDYFRSLYKGEIKTPLYPLLLDTINTIRSKKWKVAAATISHSNLSANLPLQTRFIGEQIEKILTDPLMLDRPLPQEWEERANALYLENFMQKEKIRDIYLGLEKRNPRDPSIKYFLYHLARQFNQGNLALDYLQQAVQLDPLYALEYLDLAQVASEKNRPEDITRMLQSAHTALPENPFIALHLAGNFAERGEHQQATVLLDRMTTRNWSQLYYPTEAAAVENLKKQLQK